MNKHKLLPNIRFKGFEDEWEDTVLGKFVKVYDGVHQTPKYKNNGVPFVSVENISNLYNTNKFISKSDFDNNFKNSKPTSGDLLMTRIGDIGTVNFVKNNNDLAYYVSLALLKPKTKDFKKYMNSYFLMYLIESPRTKKELWKRTLHIAFPKKINKNEISKVNLCICSNWKEQQKIGNLFAKLDKLLGLQRQNIDKLELLKKTLLQKLFPKHYAKIPELRFKGFEDDWQEKKLSHIVDIIMGQSPSSTNYYDTPIENSMILIQGNADIKHHNVKPRIWTTQITKIAMPKDVLLTVRAPVGEVVKNRYKAVIGRGMAALRGNDFLYYNLEKLKIVGYWKHLSAGSTFESISSNNIRDTKIKIPSCKEQKKVYSVLSKVDQLIELENKKLENLQQFKKCFLQNMFVE